MRERSVPKFGTKRMKKKKKGIHRIVSMILTLALLIGMVPLWEAEEVKAAMTGQTAYESTAAKRMLSMGYLKNSSNRYRLTDSFFSTYGGENTDCGVPTCFSQGLFFIGWYTEPTCTTGGSMYVGCAYGLNAGLSPHYSRAVSIAAFGHSCTGNEYISGSNYVKRCQYCGAEVYQRAASYTITFNGNGATSGSMSQQTMTAGVGGNLYGTGFRRTGYTFAGWSSSAGGGVEWRDGGIYSQSSALNVTLYAVWSKNPYKIRYHANGGNGYMADTQAYYDTAVTLSGCSFYRSGYTFGGWQMAGTGYVFGNGQAVSNLTTGYNAVVDLNAIWNPNTYRVTYHANGGVLNSNGSTTDTRYVTYSDSPRLSVDLSPTAVKDGLIFTGWSTDPNAKTGFSYLEMPPSDVTLYAIYSIPVSDVSEVYVSAWSRADQSDLVTYPLSRTGVYNMDYTYAVYGADISSVLSSGTVKWAVTSWDNAGNHSTYGDAISLLQKYQQTVEHYRFDRYLNEWVCFSSVSEMCMEGMTYTPAYVPPPEGYVQSSIDAPYVVHADTVSRAYYEPSAYRLYFDANGGTVSVSDKSIYYGDPYGDLPTPEREGYTFLGWYTLPDSGSRVVSSDRYMLTGNSTLYAHWKINEHVVLYDCTTNEGDSVSKEYITTAYGSKADLSVTSQKHGWEFIGWNTDPDAKVGLTECIMPDEDLVLYALYKKDVTATFVDCTDSGTITRESTETRFNRDDFVRIGVPVQNEMSDWTCTGWSMDTAADSGIDASSGAVISLTESTVYYGMYEKEITVSYDTNGSPQTIRDQSGRCFYNASGQKKDAEIKTASAPALSGSSFVIWEELDESGNMAAEYRPSESYLFDRNTVLTAKWDKHPTIDAFDRYFTLEEAQNGQITEERLLESVKGYDEEDGDLVNGKDVVVKDFDPSDFLTEGEHEITYEAEDSFGNKVTQTVTVHVVDTTVRLYNTLQYTRFISSRFYSDGSDLVDAEYGGLEESSIWRTDESHSRLIASALGREKKNIEYRTTEVLGKSYTTEISGSGEWEGTKETWVFTKEDIERVKKFVSDHGYGNLKENTASDLFYDLFEKCRR